MVVTRAHLNLANYHYTTLPVYSLPGLDAEATVELQWVPSAAEPTNGQGRWVPSVADGSRELKYTERELMATFWTGFAAGAILIVAAIVVVRRLMGM